MLDVADARSCHSVILNLFQDPSKLRRQLNHHKTSVYNVGNISHLPVPRWMLKQVQHDVSGSQRHLPFR